jgi:hypothetical protein
MGKYTDQTYIKRGCIDTFKGPLGIGEDKKLLAPVVRLKGSII